MPAAYRGDKREEAREAPSGLAVPWRDGAFLGDGVAVRGESTGRSRELSGITRWLVDRVCAGGGCIVDLACGQGAVTELILGSWGCRRRCGTVFAVDPSPAALAGARRRIRSRCVQVVEGSPERLSRLVPPADAILCGDALHRIARKQRVLVEVRRTLRPGGTFAFTTGSFRGCYVPGTERFFEVWALLATRYLGERGVVVDLGGGAPAPPWLTLEEYDLLVVSSGFVRASWSLHQVDLPASFEDSQEASQIAANVLPHVPWDLAVPALASTMRSALRLAGCPGSVPRYWVQCVGHAPGDRAARPGR